MMPTQDSPKNIILCSDGTGNRGGKGNGTNVWRLFNAVDLNSHKGGSGRPQQITFYDDGVGSEDGKLFKMMGGAFGWGLSRNIQDLYKSLASNYNPGDKLFLFGFSRGAFTVRSLAGMITRCGIVKRANYPSAEAFAAAVNEAFKAYKAARTDGGEAAKRFKAANSYGDEKITCIGVWDTVDAIGVPFDGLRVALDWLFKNSFHRHDLSPNIAYGYHALSIDDQRKTFHPVMWDEKLSIQNGRNEGSIEQVWFSGVHANVGGGYPKKGMAYVTLDWMMRRVSQHGLIFEAGAQEEVAKAAKVGDKLYDSRAGLAAYYRYLPRDIDAITRHCCVGNAKIHHSVFERIEQAPLGYSPGNLPAEFDIVSDGQPTPDNDPTGWDTLNTRMRENRQRHEDLLLQAKAYIQPRRHLYHVFVALTVLALIAAAGIRNTDARYAELSAFSFEGWYRPLLQYLYEQPALGAGVVLILLGLYFMRKHVIDSMQALLLEFWWKMRPLFRQ